MCEKWLEINISLSVKKVLLAWGLNQCLTYGLCCFTPCQQCRVVMTQMVWGLVFVQLLSCVQLFATPWTAAHQASLSITNSRSMLTLTSIESVMPSKHLILCRPLLLLPSIFPSIRVFWNESVLRIWWPKYWSFSFSISPSSEYLGLISFKMDWLDLLAVQGTLKESSTAPWFKGISSLALSLLYSPKSLI